ncbi:MAG: TIGR01777 family oxidoreductase [Streptosporangiaceae bacterium]|nr:TIGR01777 family oxidoreductase [Streptosporangiaceae bacterium]MBV9857416.1 TIGR01777 family oxidoreductase [Streptosporangiaceae bacterium]
MKVAITGSSGLIGTALAASLRADGHEVIRLVRRSPRGAAEVRWDPRAADAGLGGPAAGALEGTEAFVHLAGVGIGDRLWTRRRKAEIRASRVLGTRALAGALSRLSPKPAVLLAASAIGWYGDTGGREVTEQAPAAASGFLGKLVRDWEAAADPARDAGIRVVHVRSGLVLDGRGGILSRLAPLARWGLLPRFGTGEQVMSWIAVADEVGAIRFLLSSPDSGGPFNLTAPNPVTNSEFTAALHRVFGRPDPRWFRIPAPVLRLALGEMSSELLGSARVVPERLLAAGYQFRYPDAGPALAAALGR